MMRPSHYLTLIFVVATLLTGCQRDAESKWQDYLERIGRLTDQPLTTIQPFALPRYPRQRELRHPLPDLRTSFRNYLGLAECDMMGLVSERNSILSRVQTDSLLLAYELRFVALADQCLNESKLSATPEREAWLTSVYEKKISMLPDLAWNLSFAGSEMATAFSQTASGDSDLNSLARAFHDIADISRSVQAPPWPTNTDDLEAALRTLSQNTAGGHLVNRMQLAHQKLHQAAALLENTNHESLCPNGRPVQQMTYLHNVFARIYGERIQPWLARLWRDRQTLHDALYDLRRAHPQPHDPLDQWLNAHFSEQGLHGQLDIAMNRHTRAWQVLLRQCNLSPGKQ